MRLDQLAIRHGDHVAGRAVEYLPLDDTVTIAWPDGPTIYPTAALRGVDRQARLVPYGDGPRFDVAEGRWAVYYHDDGPHRRSYRCHSGVHWTAYRAGDAATAWQIWNDRDKISKIVRDVGRRITALVVRYYNDYAAVLDFRTGDGFLGAFTYPAGSRHQVAEPRHRYPAATVPEGTRLPLAALPAGAVIDATDAAGAADRRHRTLLVLDRRGPRTVRPGRPTPTVTLAVVGMADGQRCDPADEVIVDDGGTYRMDHWPHTLPDPFPTS
ncbi:hypothetical protein [Pseudofrankia saprophytica]|uniref:hypothetical protein n=1 Tax=Pseudofrankia saprophytica TaxID=298655 RepID=UPI000234BE8F|nr:hypothetical protein [Pseudofrankia saprophytica]